MGNPDQPKTEVSRRLQSRWGVFLLVTCSILLLVVFMAVPKASNHGDAYFAKQTYYNHGAHRGPHLGQLPRISDSDSQTKSRRLLVTETSSERQTVGILGTKIVGQRKRSVRGF